MSVTRLLGDINARIETRTKAIKNSVESLLPDVYRRVYTLRAAKKLVEDQLAPDFRIFDYMRDDENGLSRCLADLLDPKGRHGQGSLFLNAFLERTPSADWAEASQCRSVKTEKTTNEGRRIDIFMEFDNGVIGIENKPWAGDQPLQLSDYSDWLMAFSSKKKWLLIFLSNREPEVSSIPADRRGSLFDDRHFFQMDFDDLANWMDECAAKTKALTVRIFVEELAKYIRTRVNQEIDMSEELEVRQSVLKSSENLAGAFFVAKSFEGIKRELLQKLEKDIRAGLRANGYEFEHNKEFFNGRGGSEICVLFDSQQDARLCFGFDCNWHKDFYWGIAKISKEAIKSDAAILEISQVMATHFGDSGDQISFDDVWPWFVYANGTELDKAFRDWQNNPRPWQAMLDGSLANTMVNIAIKVHDAFKDRMDLLMPTTKAPVFSGAPGDLADEGACPTLSSQGNDELAG
jgi:hypothetical protein